MRLRTAQSQRSGVVLLAVLVAVILLSLAAFQFSNLMLSEYRAADSYRRSVQARANAESGLHYAAALLATPDSILNNLNGNPFSNSSMFQGIVVADNEQSRLRGLFSVLVPSEDADSSSGNQPYRFGVIDETGKLNLNALMKLDPSGGILEDRLLELPNMTEDVANAILDWLDEDEDPGSNGAENEYYMTLEQPYRCKNGPLDSVEELLLVKGVGVGLLFGNDRNRNGVLDPDEDDGTGILDRGWSGYLTVYSREQNVDSTGQPRIYINDNDVNGLESKLTTAGIDAELAKFIVEYRRRGPYQQSQSSQSSNTQGGTTQNGSTPSGGTQGGATRGGGQSTTPSTGSTTPSTSQPATNSTPTNSRSGRGGRGSSRNSGNQGTTQGGGTQGGSTQGGGTQSSSGSQTRISSMFQLVNAQVQIPGENGQMTLLDSPLNDPSKLRELLPVLLDKATPRNEAELPARVNINTAPAAVLASLPGLDEADVQNILSRRPSLSSQEAPDEIYQTTAWLMTEANFTKEKITALEQYVTSRSQVYRVQVVGYFEGGGPSSRIEAVIDTSGGKPRIAYWRDLTELGRGFDLTTTQP